jgi:serine/threonine protein kinase
MNLTGTTLNNYVIGSLIGHGSNGVVYEAQKTGERKKLAVKVLQGSLIATPEFPAKFLAWMGSIQVIKHPNIVNSLDVFVENNLSVMVMEFMPEGSASTPDSPRARYRATGG